MENYKEQGFYVFLRLKSEVRELKMSKQTLDQQKAVLEKELNAQVRENQNLSMNVKSKGISLMSIA